MTLISLDFKQNDSLFEYPVVLDGVGYTFVFFYSSFDESWFLSIKDVVNNIKIVNGIDLLAQHRFLEVPSGELRAVRRSGRKSKPGFNDIGPNNEIELIYITST